MNLFEFIKSRVKNLFTKTELKEITTDLQISDKMSAAINDWFILFYLSKNKNEEKTTRFAKILTSYMATLAVNEIKVSAGTGARADFITQQIERFVMPEIHNNIQLAGVGGEVILKPYVSGRNIFSEAVFADRFYPTRFNALKQAEAGFFTDFDTLYGKEVVKIEYFDLQPDGYYISQRAFYKKENGLGAEIPLTSVERWKDLQPDIIITDVDRPLFVQLKMPFANTVDPSSKLPISVYADSVESIRELDRIYSEFLWEIHTGKRKRIVDFTAIKPKKGVKSIKNTDLATDLYLVMDLGFGAEKGAKPFDDYTPEMRVEAYQKAVNVQLRLIEMQCGFSAGTFTFDIRTGKLTATQIISEDKDTYNTIKAVQNSALNQPLKDLIYIYDIFAALYNLAPSGKIEPSVIFGDGIFEDTATEFIRRKAMADSGYLKKEKLTAWYFGISEDEALESYMPEEETPDDILFGDE